MGYSPRLTIENYVRAMLRADYQLLPPRKPGCYSVWHADFQGSDPPVSAKNEIVYVGKTEKCRAELLYRVTELVLDAIGKTGAGNLRAGRPNCCGTTPFWDLPRGLAAVLEADDDIVEVTPDYIKVLKCRRDILRFVRNVS